MTTAVQILERGLTAVALNDYIKSEPRIAELDLNGGSRRGGSGGLLVKLLTAVSKHKWAYPFKRPVTDREAPDYKTIVSNPMDFSTLKRRVETGAVSDVAALVADLNLIFENAMAYNGAGTDYYKMADTLKATVARQLLLYNAKKAAGPADEPAGGADEEAKPPPPLAAAAAAAPPADDKPKGRQRRGGR